jgi:hypothetical protein
LSATSDPVAIDGASTTTFAATLGNQGVGLANVTLQGWINQGTARRAAGGAITIDCGSGSGVLPIGSFPATGPITASNTSAGSGTLVSGAATFELDLMENGVVLDTKTAPVTLVPNTPAIASLTPSTTSVLIGGPGVSFTTTLRNPGPSASSVALQAYINQGSAQNAAGGALISVGAGLGVLPTGTSTCTGGFNTSIGSYVAGPATLLIQLIQGGSVVSSTTLPITLAPKPTITTVIPTSSTILLEGIAAVPYTVTILNQGASLSNMTLNAAINQGTAQRQTASIVDFSGNHLVLPSGNGVGTGQITASNSNSGSGTLAAGSATFALSLKQGQFELATASIPITIALPSPTISSVDAFLDLVIGGSGVSCMVTIANPGLSLSNASVQLFIEQGSTKRAAGTIAAFGGASGLLPAGASTGATSMTASNSSDGTGILVAGDATLDLQLIVNGVVKDTKLMPVSLEEGVIISPPAGGGDA